MKRLVLLALLTLVVGACTADDPGQAPRTDSPVASTPPILTGVPSSPPTTTTPACPVVEGWNTAADEEPGSSTEQLVRVRAGQHDCFDRVVFDIAGTAPAGFTVRYVPQVRADGSGEPVPVAGGAALMVIVRSYVRGYPDGTPLASNGDRFFRVADLARWQALRAVRYAGFFEGQVTLALGVRTKLPFRAYTVVEKGSAVRKVVVDIAHR